MAQTLPMMMVTTEERAQLAQLRIQAVQSRPSTVAAQEFFAGDRKSKSLARRIRRLTQVLESWVRERNKRTHGIVLVEWMPQYVSSFLTYHYHVIFNVSS